MEIAMTKNLAEFAVNELEKAIIEANHKMANAANKHYVNRLKAEMVQLLTNVEYSKYAEGRIGR